MACGRLIDEARRGWINVFLAHSISLVDGKNSRLQVSGLEKGAVLSCFTARRNGILPDGEQRRKMGSVASQRSMGTETHGDRG